MYKILIIGPSWVGDSMLMQPMLKRLRQRHPDCQIDVLAPPWTEDLLLAMQEIDNVIFNPFDHGTLLLHSRFRLGRQLRHNHYDQAIVLPNSLKSALVPFFARIPLRTGYIGEMRYGLLNDARRLHKKKHPLLVERYAQLAERAGAGVPLILEHPRLQVAQVDRDAALYKLHLTLDKPVVVFCPGAEYGPAKRWPIAYFAEIAQRLDQNGYSVWLVGSAKDREVAEKIVALGNASCQNLCGRTDLKAATALLSCADMVISNDSGLMHLAAALDRPLLALFGSSSPKFTPPLSDKAQVIKLDISCSPCFKRECPLGHFNCMNNITPNLVWEKLTASLPTPIESELPHAEKHPQGNLQGI